MTVAAPLTAEGQRIVHQLDRVTLVVACIRPGASYRASVHLGATAGVLGREVPELSQSFATELEARAAARRICKAFADQPADLPFAVIVERALASIAAQFDELIARALGGGDGTGRVAAPLAGLTAAREALRTPAERIAEQELLERLRADLDAYDVDARYAAAIEGAGPPEYCGDPVDPACGPDLGVPWCAYHGGTAPNPYEEYPDAVNAAPARSFAELRDRHAAAIARDRAV